MSYWVLCGTDSQCREGGGHVIRFLLSKDGRTGTARGVGHSELRKQVDQKGGGGIAVIKTGQGK